MAGFEPATSSLPRKCSTPELHWHFKNGAEDEAQTRDPQLGRLMLYQLSYFRILQPDRYQQRKRYIKPTDRCGRRWIRTTEGKNQQIYSLPHLATLVFALEFKTNFCNPSDVLTPDHGELLPRRGRPAVFQKSLLSDSNQRPRDYKSRALAN